MSNPTIDALANEFLGAPSDKAGNFSSWIDDDGQHTLAYRRDPYMWEITTSCTAKGFVVMVFRSSLKGGAKRRVMSFNSYRWTDKPLPKS